MVPRSPVHFPAPCPNTSPPRPSSPCCLAPSGDLQRLQSALAASGTVALAALQANTYRLPQSLQQTTRWNDALAAASAGGAGAQAYLTVMPGGL
jgi:hypothetical protein